MRKRAIFLLTILLLHFLTITVKAFSPFLLRCISTDERVVALTFDDGPHPRHTPAILELLAEYDAKATFFVIGKNMELYADVAMRIVEGGHELGNHTYAHPHLSSLSEKEIRSEILKNEAIIEETVGISPRLFRPPEGYCPSAVSRAAIDNGYSVILWSIDTRDWSGVSASAIASHVLKSITPGAIVLFHDYIAYDSPTLLALKEILPRLSEAGFRFVTVSELLSYGREAIEDQ